MLLDQLKNHKVILASVSPRRKQLMDGLAISYTIETPVDVAEIIPVGMPAEEAPVYLARVKSEAFGRQLLHNELLITADTVVLCNGQLLGKPVDKADAERMLKMLSGNQHEVLTGVCLRSRQKMHTFMARTVVYFRPLSMQEIDFYLERYRPYDKAGAYGAQEWIGYAGIERIEGSYFNVMGLPVQQLYIALEEFLSNNS
jgi:septum formation protein